MRVDVQGEFTQLGFVQHRFGRRELGGRGHFFLGFTLRAVRSHSESEQHGAVIRWMPSKDYVTHDGEAVQTDTFDCVKRKLV